MANLTDIKDSTLVAQELFRAEIEALQEVSRSIAASDNFNQAVDLILETKGRAIVTGMGKSGHIGAKIAATLASTGTPSFFVHPAEMGHGDLGMLVPEDIVIALSFSGNTDELRKVLAPIKRMEAPLIAITANAQSVLAEYSDVLLLTPIKEEACPLNLAPTSSTTAALVMGDALAVALMKKRDFSSKDFAKSHPLGSLGKSLILVKEVMRLEKDLPKVSIDSSLDEVLAEIEAKKLGLTTVLNSSGQLVGTITDGDLRRAQIHFKADIFTKKAQDLITNNKPKTIKEDSIAMSAVKIMEDNRISDVIVVDSQDKPVGIIDLKDLLAAGLI